MRPHDRLPGGHLRFLCVCDRGNTRSHAMAVVLKGRGHEAVAIGRFTAKPDTLELLMGWADRIIIMEPHMRESIPREYWPDLWTVDVGPDQWGSQVDPFLREMCEEGADFILP